MSKGAFEKFPWQFAKEQKSNNGATRHRQDVIQYGERDLEKRESKTMKKMTICAECGAKFPADSPKCPYCNAIYEPAAEKKYIRDLNELKEDMSELPKEAEQLYKKKMLGEWKRVLLILLIVAAFAAVAGGIYFLYKRHMEAKYSYDPKAQLLWEKKYFPQFDELYAAGDYDGILEILDETYEEGGTIWNWEHGGFIMDYQAYLLFMDCVDDITDKEKANKKTAQYMVGEAMLFVFFKDEADYTEAEWEQVQGWQTEAKKVLYGEMKFTEEEAQELYEEINEDGYINYSKCDKYTAKIWKRFIEP